MRIVGKSLEYRKLKATYIKNRKQRRKYWLNKYKTAKGCQRCGIKTNSIIYDWHHIDGKDFAINTKITTSLKRLFKEIRKCILVCSNCHRLIHEEERNGM